MKLSLVHQILIAGAMAMSALFGLRSIVIGGRDGSGAHLALGVASFVALVGLGFYLRRFRRKLRESTKQI